MTDKPKPPPKVKPQPKADGGEPPPLTEADLQYHERRRQGWRSNAAYPALHSRRRNGV